MSMDTLFISKNKVIIKLLNWAVINGAVINRAVINWAVVAWAVINWTVINRAVINWAVVAWAVILEARVEIPPFFKTDHIVMNLKTFIQYQPHSSRYT